MNTIDLFSRLGKKAIGSRLRRLSERITEDAAQVYKMYDVGLQPKWFPVFYVLSEGDEKTITAIAEEIGHSHPSVSKIIAEMSRKGLVAAKTDKEDGRRNVVKLSAKGKEVVRKIQDQYTDVNSAVEGIFSETANDLWRAIEEWEFLLDQKSLLRRVQEKRKARESQAIRIVKYEPKYKKAFKSLNEEWISKYFKMEKTDYASLDDPKGYILDKGGHIFVALDGEKPVGVCALLKMNDPEYDFELVKMGVSPESRGKNIGWLLGKAALDKAKQHGAKKVYLESNTVLVPAISLYQKLGFKKVIDRPTPYERCNIQMGISL